MKFKKALSLLAAAAVLTGTVSGCSGKTQETSESSAETSVTAEETVEETVAETSAHEEGGIPQPGDTYNGHTVDHTEDQPNCDDGSHGTIWIFYTDSDAIDYIEY